MLGWLQLLESVTGALWILSFEDNNAVRLGEEGGAGRQPLGRSVGPPED